MIFEDVSNTVHFLDGIPGNIVAYIRLNEAFPEVITWKESEWLAVYRAFYTKIENPGSAWLHDIYKNHCEYDIDRTYRFISDLKIS